MARKKRAPLLASYLLAGFPCLYLDTVEEERAIEAIKKAADSAVQEGEEVIPYTILSWRVTSGFTLEGGQDLGTAKSEDMKNLNTALTFVADQSKNTPTIGIFMNLRKLLEHPVAIQTLKDAINKARVNGNHIFIVGPMLQLPPELAEAVTFFDFPLPSLDQISDLYTNLIGAYDGALNTTDLKESIGKAASSAVGMTLLEAENAIALSMTETNGIDIPLIQEAKEQAIKKSEVLELFRTDDTLDNVGDFDLMKAWMQKRTAVFTDAAKEYGLPNPKGVLLVGPPGTGKSLVAKAAANFLELPLVKFDIGSIFRKYVGESEGMVRKALQTIEAVAPVVVWFDELEKGFAGVSSSGSTDSGVTSRVLSTILTWMQERTCLAFSFATVNNIQGLPPEVYRAGRFDCVFSTDLPQFKGRKEIFAIHINKRGRKAAKFDLETIAAKSVGFVGAEIEHIVEEAMFTAFFDKKREFTTEDILREIRTMKPQSVTDAERITAIREFCRTRTRPVSSDAPAWTDMNTGAGGNAKRQPKRKIKSKEKN